MKHSEFKRWLISRGVTVGKGKGHDKLYYNGRQSTLPRHPGKEIGEGLRKQILKQLDMKED